MTEFKNSISINDAFSQVFENEDYDIELANKLIKKDKNPMADSSSSEEQLKVESNSN